MIKYRKNTWLERINAGRIEIWLYNTKTKQEKLIYTDDISLMGRCDWKTYTECPSGVQENYISKKEAEELMFIASL